MKNKYIAPAIHPITLDSELYFMSGSSETKPEELDIHDEKGNGTQLSKFHTLFDETEDEDDW